MIGHGRYSDGRFLGSVPVTFVVAQDRLSVMGSGVELDVDAGAVRVSQRIAAVPSFLYLPGGAVVETPDHSACAALAARRRWSLFGRFVHVLENHAAVAAVATLLVVAAVVLGLRVGLPALAREVAQRVPAAIDQQAGRAALAALDAHLGRSGLPAAKRKHVRDQLARLYPPGGSEAMPRLEFRFMGPGVANALALPGDIIVVTDALVELATDDELAAVFAHEIGHLQERHALQGALRSSFALLFVTTATGDLSALTSFAATVPFLILNNGYARDLEREADQFAHDRLAARGIDPTAFSRILEKLEAANPAVHRLTYLSTHPSTEERIERFGRPAPDTGSERPRGAIQSGEDPVKDAGLPAEPEKPRPPLATTEQPDVPPKPISQPAPKYPFALRRAGATGEVTVAFVVDRQGHVHEAHVVNSTHAGFESSALNAVRQWRFLPAMKDGQPVNARLVVPIRYEVAGEHESTGADGPLRPEEFVPPPPTVTFP